MLRSPLVRTPSGMPTPSSVTVSTTSSPTARLTSTDDALACRAALDSASLSTASRCGRTASGTALSTGPSVLQDRPEAERRPRAPRRCRRARSAGRPVSPAAAQLEDGAPDLADRGVDVVDRGRDPGARPRAWSPSGPRSPGSGRWRRAAGSPGRAGRGRSGPGPRRPRAALVLAARWRPAAPARPARRRSPACAVSAAGTAFAASSRPGQREDAGQLALGAQRQGDHPGQVLAVQGGSGRAVTGEGQDDLLAGAHDGRGHAPVRRQDRADAGRGRPRPDAPRRPAGRRLVHQGDRRQVGLRHLSRPVGDQLQHVLATDVAEQRGGDLGRGLEPALPPARPPRTAGRSR